MDLLAVRLRAARAGGCGIAAHPDATSRLPASWHLEARGRYRTTGCRAGPTGGPAPGSPRPTGVPRSRLRDSRWHTSAS